MDDPQAKSKLMLLFPSLSHLILLISFCLGSTNPCVALEHYQSLCLPSQELALIKFKDGLIDSSNRLESWKLGSDCCEWRGVTCDNQTGYVTALDLHNPQNIYVNLPLDVYAKERPANSLDTGLGGKLDIVLTNLERLQFLDLSLNSFEGNTIPEFLGSMEELKHLDVSYAGFHGRIPPNLGNLSKLEYLDVSSLVHTKAKITYNTDIWNEARTSYLSCDNNLQWMTNLVSLEFIKMTGVNLSEISHEPMHVFKSLPSLEQLSLSHCSLSAMMSLPSANFSSLQILDLSANHLVSEFPKWVVNITSLQHMDLSVNRFEGEFMYGLSELPYLQFMSVSYNQNLKINCNKLFVGRWSYVERIDIEYTNFSGGIPSSIGNITSLKHLSVTSDERMRSALEGNIPTELGKLDLKVLSLKYNKFVGKFPPSIINPQTLQYLQLTGVDLQSSVSLSWFCKFKFLVELWLNNCHLTGSFPTCLAQMPYLILLSLGSNRLNGTIPLELGKQSQLMLLDLSHNLLVGIVHEGHLQNLKSLQFLSLSYNTIVFKPHHAWSPPLHLNIISLASCQIGPFLPPWLKSLDEVQYIDLSSNLINGSLPLWFKEKLPTIVHLNLSHNQIHGHLPSPFVLFQSDQTTVDLSFNLFSGPFPSFPSGITFVDLSHNRITGPLPHNVGSPFKGFRVFFASRNQINGTIPLVFGKMDSLKTLDLAGNQLIGPNQLSFVGSPLLDALDLKKNLLSGEVELHFSKTNVLRSLHLGCNDLSGEFPRWLENCTHLEVLDLSRNQFFGKIPPWIGKNCASLKILDLSSNKFSGRIPWELSYLASLQVLNVAKNRLHGSIPKSFGNFKSMKEKHLLVERFPVDDGYYMDKLIITVSGKEDEYTTILFLVNCLDLSDNNFSGQIPQELTNLSELLVLNLSHNQLEANIPGSIGALKQLFNLDLSYNHLSGRLPQNLAALTFLNYMNLSYNNFSGEIPSGFQLQTLDDPSIYLGNPGLCGFPLKNNCSNGRSSASPNSMARSWEVEGYDQDSLDMFSFYVSMGPGFVVGFWAVCATLMLKRTWRVACFRFFGDSTNKLFVLVAIMLPQWLKRNMGRLRTQ